MKKFFYNWRFYSYGREQYQQCMNNTFFNNLQNLKQGNLIVAIYAFIYSVMPILTEKLDFSKVDFFNVGVCLLVAVIAMILFFISNYTIQLINVKNSVIYTLITFYYLNLVFFGIHQSIWITPDKPASLIYAFLVIALLLFINPPQFNFLLTLFASAVFAGFSIFKKDYQIWIYDVIHIIIAGSMNMFFSWQISKLRMGLELSAAQLEEERNKYEDQSITDELTRLRNKRDFSNTFQRYLSNFRSSDDFICIAIADIDFFKFYNDHYGHLKGDDCLRTIGAVLNNLKEELGIYTARVGGEEFAALWFEKDVVNVDKVINHWIEAIKAQSIPHEKSKVNDFVTMSIGVYISRCGAYRDTKVLYDLADKALYTAKQGGRNAAIINGDDIKEYKISLKKD